MLKSMLDFIYYDVFLSRYMTTMLIQYLKITLKLILTFTRKYERELILLPEEMYLSAPVFSLYIYIFDEKEDGRDKK